jgi:tetratricopeptide (TPR) repeat protein
MILADSGQRRDEALAQARKAASRLDTLFGLGKASESEMTMGAPTYNNIALAHKNLHLYDDAVRYARREIDISQSLPFAALHVGNALSIIADARRLSGDLGGSLQAIREARSTVERADFPNEAVRRITLFNVLWREGMILGADGAINFGQTSEAVAALQKAFDLIEEWAQKDPNDSSSRILFASAGRELGSTLHHRDPRRALAVYDQALLRLGEIKNNTKARRGEAQLLAGSSYALRRLNRIGEAKDRIDGAFRLLRETKDYPAARINPDDEASAALRALGDHHAETGQPRRAAEGYQELHDKTLASKPEPLNNLSHATALSRIYEALAGLHRRNGQPDRAEAMSALRLEIWRHWDSKLPHNAFVRRHLDAVNLP